MEQHYPTYEQLHPKYFGEKSEQMNVQSITAFGIVLFSRDSKAHEMAEMLNFSCKIAKAGLHQLVTRVDYDSRPQICTFEFLNGDNPYGEAETSIYEIATETISQFEWIDGIIHHRKDIAAEESEYPARYCREAPVDETNPSSGAD